MIKFKREDGTYSRTQLFNTLSALATAVLSTLPGVREQIPPEAYGWTVMIVTLANVYLRQTTTQSVK